MCDADAEVAGNDYPGGWAGVGRNRLGKGSVHENTLQEVVYADEKKMLAFLNNIVVPAMRLLGYKIPENAKIIVAIM